MAPDDAVAAVGALADVMRRKIYDYIVTFRGPVTRDDVATALEMSPSKAKFHLDRLERDGLLDVAYRRLSGRTGPGAGRPSKLYTRSARDVQVSLPARRYDVAGAVLASAIEHVSTGDAMNQAVADAAYAQGAGDARAAGVSRPTDASHASATDGSGGVSSSRAGRGSHATVCAERALARLGYEPEAVGNEVVLHNCPFDSLVSGHRELVCTMNKSYVQAVLDHATAGELASTLEPRDGYCCVIARPVRA